MDAYNFDSIRFQTQERLDRRTHEAAAERLRPPASRHDRDHAGEGTPPGELGLAAQPSRLRTHIYEGAALVAGPHAAPRST